MFRPSSPSWPARSSAGCGGMASCAAGGAATWSCSPRLRGAAQVGDRTPLPVLLAPRPAMVPPCGSSWGCPQRWTQSTAAPCATCEAMMNYCSCKDPNDRMINNKTVRTDTISSVRQNELSPRSRTRSSEPSPNKPPFATSTRPSRHDPPCSLAVQAFTLPSARITVCKLAILRVVRVRALF